MNEQSIQSENMGEKRANVALIIEEDIDSETIGKLIAKSVKPKTKELFMEGFNCVNFWMLKAPFWEVIAKELNVKKIEDHIRCGLDNATHIRFSYSWFDSDAPNIKSWAFTTDSEFERMNFLIGLCDYAIALSTFIDKEEGTLILDKCPRIRTFLALRDELQKTGKCTYATYRKSMK